MIADMVTVLRDGKHICDAEVSEIDEDFLVSNMVGIDPAEAEIGMPVEVFFEKVDDELTLPLFRPAS